MRATSIILRTFLLLQALLPASSFALLQRTAPCSIQPQASLHRESTSRLRFSNQAANNVGKDRRAPSTNSSLGRTFLKNLSLGVALPFPALRRILSKKKSKSSTFSFDLSMSRAMLALVCYYLLGVLFYSVYFAQHWSIPNALYFCSVCLSTVGYGDLCPQSPKAKLFTCVFGLGGIMFLSTAVATLGGRLLQAETDALHHAKVASQDQVKTWFPQMNSVLKDLRNKSQHNETTVQEVVVEATEKSDNRLSKVWTMVTRTVLRVLPSFTIIFGGAAVLRWLNGHTWSLVDTIYYSIVTASTIGFGDLVPTCNAAKMFCCFYIPLAVAAAGELLSGLAMALVDQRQRKVFDDIINGEQRLTLDNLREMDTNGDGKISCREYTLFMLMSMGRVTQQEIVELEHQFEALDVTKSGYLDKQDLILMAQLRREKLKAKRNHEVQNAE